MGFRAVLEQLFAGDEAGVVVECRQCGTKLSSNSDECPECGSTEISRYRISE